MLLDAEKLKEHLRILHSDEDALIESYSKAAQEFAENYLGVQLEEKEYKVDVKKIALCWTFPKQPITELVSVKSAGADVSAVYWEDLGIARLRVKKSEDVTIVFKAGYKTDKVPESILQWIRCAVSEMYEYRELDESKFINSFAIHLLKPYRISQR